MSVVFLILGMIASATLVLVLFCVAIFIKDWRKENENKKRFR